MKKTLEDAVVVLNRAILPDIWQMELLSPKIAAGAEPGQFVMVKKPKSAHLLRRPFGVADIDDEKGTITLFYRILGEGTAELSTLRSGETLSVEGALGTGFTLTDEPALL
ncbi:MAG: FAD-binding oxidoreductase, partial [Selenomonas sp.]